LSRGWDLNIITILVLTARVRYKLDPEGENIIKPLCEPTKKTLQYDVRLSYGSLLAPIERILTELRMKILRLVLLSSNIEAPDRIRKYTEVSAFQIEKYKLDPEDENINGRYTFEPAINLQLLNKSSLSKPKTS